MNITLPAIELEKKWRVASVGYLLFCVLYTIAGAAPFRKAQVLNPSELDRLIPFIPATVWIYMAQFFFLFFSVMSLKKTETISRALYAMGAASAFSFAVFFVYPTTIAREMIASEGWTGGLFEFLYRIDSSANCFPSLHVSLAWIAAAALFEEHGRKGLIAFFIAAAISLSTLTTRQHYFIDILSGLAVAALCRGLLSKIAFKAQAPVHKS
ncbi:MAG: phosphatase PAP2 family protein [Acidobacteriota bacterium]